MNTSSKQPSRLSRLEICERLPHAGRMVLLDEIEDWDEEHIVARTAAHRDRANPLVVAGQLSSVCAVEFAAQAMAVHGNLVAQALNAHREPTRPRVGFLASVRNVRMEVDRLDDIHGALTIEAVRESGDATRVLYGFVVRSGTRPLVSGRAAVVLDADASPFP